MRKTPRQQVKKWKGKVTLVPVGSSQEMATEKQRQAHVAVPPWLLHPVHPLPVRLSVPSWWSACSQWGGTSCVSYLYKWFIYRHEVNSLKLLSQPWSPSVDYQQAIHFLSRREKLFYNANTELAQQSSVSRMCCKWNIHVHCCSINNS